MSPGVSLTFPARGGTDFHTREKLLGLKFSNIRKMFLEMVNLISPDKSPGA